MTNLLQRAFEEASQLPDAEQDALASILLDEIRSEEAWQERFDSSQDALLEVARQALEEAHRGEAEEFTAEDL